MNSEMWKPIAECPRYQVSSKGRVRNERGRVLKGTPSGGTGYMTVKLSAVRGGRQKTHNVHRLVADSFLGPIPEELEVRHLNGVRTDNRLENLALGTHSENERDKLVHGTHATAFKAHCPSGHPYDEENTKWYQGRRYCRACHRADGKRRRERNKTQEETL